jgi:hypothetical protein
MNLIKRIYNTNPLSAYVYVVSTLMIGQVIVYALNEQYNWFIRKHLFNLLSESAHHVYLDLLLLLIMFSGINVFITPVIAIVIGIAGKTGTVIVISLIAAILYYLFLIEIGPGLI